MIKLGLKGSNIILLADNSKINQSRSGSWSKWFSNRMGSLRSKRFRLVSEQKKTVERDFRFWPREKWNENQKMKEGGGGGKRFLPLFPKPSPIFYLHHFSRCLWLLFLILCSWTAQKRLLSRLGPEHQLMAGKRAEKTKHDFRCPICRSAQSLCGWLGDTECRWNSLQGFYSRQCSSQFGQGKRSSEGEKCSFKRYFQWSLKYKQLNREENSLRHVAMVAKFLGDNESKRHLKSGFAMFQNSSILFHFICQMLAKFSGLDPKGPNLSLEKEKENFCVVLFPI